LRANFAPLPFPGASRTLLAGDVKRQETPATNKFWAGSPIEVTGKVGNDTPSRNETSCALKTLKLGLFARAGCRAGDHDVLCQGPRTHGTFQAVVARDLTRLARRIGADREPPVDDMAPVFWGGGGERKGAVCGEH